MSFAISLRSRYGTLFPVDQERAAVQGQEPQKGLEQRRFPDPVRPKQTKRLARLQGKRHAAQDVAPSITGADLHGLEPHTHPFLRRKRR